ncbi:hypothetical protein [Metamycoplasma canadense]|uniref:Uncharacterized protein n=1 Tax=Metamycoplasma canadense TaxID=29554 RepID=A0A077L638_9BACT|nr:hypothetical protein [Metamycoplasma canadense]BAP39760.1 hypothetical protein MCAN360_0719 [Metamycoplasma canadense]
MSKRTKKEKKALVIATTTLLLSTIGVGVLGGVSKHHRDSFINEKNNLISNLKSKIKELFETDKEKYEKLALAQNLSFNKPFIQYDVSELKKLIDILNTFIFNEVNNNLLEFKKNNDLFKEILHEISDKDFLKNLEARKAILSELNDLKDIYKLSEINRNNVIPKLKDIFNKKSYSSISFKEAKDIIEKTLFSQLDTKISEIINNLDKNIAEYWSNINSNTKTSKEKEVILDTLNKYDQALKHANLIESPLKRNKYLKLIKSSPKDKIDDILQQVIKEANKDDIEERKSLIHQLSFLNKTASDEDKAKIENLLKNNLDPNFSKNANDLIKELEKKLENKSSLNYLINLKKENLKSILENNSTLSEKQKELFKNKLEKTDLSNNEINLLQKTIFKEIELSRNKKYAKEIIDLLDEPEKTQFGNNLALAKSIEKIREIEDKALEIYNKAKDEFDKHFDQNLENKDPKKQKILNDIIAINSVKAFKDGIKAIDYAINENLNNLKMYALGVKDLLKLNDESEFVQKWVSNFDLNIKTFQKSKSILEIEKQLKDESLKEAILYKSKIVSQGNSNLNISKKISELETTLKNSLFNEKTLNDSFLKINEINLLIIKDSFSSINGNKTKIDNYKEKDQLLKFLDSNDTIDIFVAQAKYNLLSRVLLENEIFKTNLDKLIKNSQFQNDEEIKKVISLLQETTEKNNDIKLPQKIVLDLVNKNFNEKSNEQKAKLINKVLTLLNVNTSFILNETEKINLETEGNNSDQELVKTLDEYDQKMILRYELASIYNLANKNADLILKKSELKSLILNINSTKEQLESAINNVKEAFLRAINKSDKVREELIKKASTFNELFTINDDDTKNIENFNILLEALSPLVLSDISKFSEILSNLNEIEKINKEKLKEIITNLDEKDKDKNLEIEKLDSNEISKKLIEFNDKFNENKINILKDVESLDYDNPNKKGLLLLIKESKNQKDLKNIKEIIKQKDVDHKLKKELLKLTEKFKNPNLTEEWIKKITLANDNESLEKIKKDLISSISNEENRINELKALNKTLINKIQDPGKKDEFLKELNSDIHTINSFQSLQETVNQFLTLETSKIEARKREIMNLVSKLSVNNSLKKTISESISKANLFTELKELEKQVKDSLNKKKNEVKELLEKLGSPLKEKYIQDLNKLNTEIEFEELTDEINSILKNKKDALTKLINDIINDSKNQNIKENYLDKLSKLETIDQFNSLQSDLEKNLNDLKTEVISWANKLSDSDDLILEINKKVNFKELNDKKLEIQAKLDNIYKNAQEKLKLLEGDDLYKDFSDKFNNLSNESHESELNNFISKINELIEYQKNSINEMLNTIKDKNKKHEISSSIKNEIKLVDLKKLIKESQLQVNKEKSIENIKKTLVYADSLDAYKELINSAKDEDQLKNIIKEVNNKENQLNDLKQNKIPLEEKIKSLVNVDVEKQKELLEKLELLREDKLSEIENELNTHIQKQKDVVKEYLEEFLGNNPLKQELEIKLSSLNSETDILKIKEDLDNKLADLRKKIIDKIELLTNDKQKSQLLEQLNQNKTIEQINETLKQVEIQSSKENLLELLNNVKNIDKKEVLNSKIEAFNDNLKYNELHKEILDQIEKDLAELELASFNVNQELNKLLSDQENKYDYFNQLIIKNSQSKEELEKITNEIKKYISDKKESILTKVEKLKEDIPSTINKYQEIKEEIIKNNDDFNISLYNKFNKEINSNFDLIKNLLVTDSKFDTIYNSETSKLISELESLTIENSDVTKIISQHKKIVDLISNKILDLSKTFKSNKDVQEQKYSRLIEKIVYENYENKQVENLMKINEQLTNELKKDNEKFEQLKQEILTLNNNLESNDKTDLLTKINDSTNTYEKLLGLKTNIEEKINQYKEEIKQKITAKLEGYENLDTLLTTLDSKNSYDDMKSVEEIANKAFIDKKNALISMLDSSLEQQEKNSFKNELEKDENTFSKLKDLEIKIELQQAKNKAKELIKNIEDPVKKAEFEEKINANNNISEINKLNKNISSYNKEQDNKLEDLKNKAVEVINKLENSTTLKQEIKNASKQADVEKIIEDAKKKISDLKSDINKAFEKLNGHEDFSSISQEDKNLENLNETELKEKLDSLEQAYNEKTANLKSKFEALNAQDNFPTQLNNYFNNNEISIEKKIIALTAKETSSLLKDIENKSNILPDSLNKEYKDFLLSNSINENADLNEQKKLKSIVESKLKELEQKNLEYKNEVDDIKLRIDDILSRVKDPFKLAEFNEQKQAIKFDNSPEINDLNKLESDINNYLNSLKTITNQLLSNLKSDDPKLLNVKQVLDSDQQTDEGYKEIRKELELYIEEYTRLSSSSVEKINGHQEYEILKNKILNNKSQTVNSEVKEKAERIFNNKTEIVKKELNDFDGEKNNLEQKLTSLNTYKELDQLEKEIQELAKNQVLDEINKLQIENQKTNFKSELATFSTVSQFNELKKRVKDKIIYNDAIAEAKAQAITHINKLWNSKKDELLNSFDSLDDVNVINSRKEDAIKALENKKKEILQKIKKMPFASQSQFNNDLEGKIGEDLVKFEENLNKISTKFEEFEKILPSLTYINNRKSILESTWVHDKVNTEEKIKSLSDEYSSINQKYSDLNSEIQKLPINNSVRQKSENILNNNSKLKNISDIEILIAELKEEYSKLNNAYKETKKYADLLKNSSNHAQKDLFNNENIILDKEELNEVSKIKTLEQEFKKQLSIEKFGFIIDYNNLNLLEINTNKNKKSNLRQGRYYGIVGTGRTILSVLPALNKNEKYKMKVNNQWQDIGFDEKVKEGKTEIRLEKPLKNSASFKDDYEFLELIGINKSYDSISYNQVAGKNNLSIKKDYSIKFNPSSYPLDNLVDGNKNHVSRWDNWNYWGKPQDDNKITLTSNEEIKNYGKIDLWVRSGGMGSPNEHMPWGEYKWPHSFTIRYSKDGKKWHDVEDQTVKYTEDLFVVDQNLKNKGILSENYNLPQKKSEISDEDLKIKPDNMEYIIYFNIKFKPVEAKYIQVTWKASTRTINGNDNWTNIIGFSEFELGEVQKEAKKVNIDDLNKLNNINPESDLPKNLRVLFKNTPNNPATHEIVEWKIQDEEINKKFQFNHLILKGNKTLENLDFKEISVDLKSQINYYYTIEDLGNIKFAQNNVNKEAKIVKITIYRNDLNQEVRTVYLKITK